ncbi:hypothetical protein FB192DRAFT_1056488 [Mucor lusitanicus]|uniref:Secreted protein n=1 Tax=Mucor circinelloides f. lusitanicus TaxID=29924 RepID=A0A8H4BPA4_MUCCL|nr:hypothetical protein FB192DRAFT_1056488 [Mucor lusitanicus]
MATLFQFQIACTLFFSVQTCRKHPNNHTHQEAGVEEGLEEASEAIEHRFAAFYLPSMTQDPWKHLSTDQP